MREWAKLVQKACDLALVICAFASVNDMSKCEGLFLGDLGNIRIMPITGKLNSWDGRSFIPEQHDAWYLIVSKLLSGGRVTETEGTNLYSNWGWSVYINTFGDLDPSALYPGEICIACGVPVRDGDVGHFIKDGPLMNQDGPLMTRCERVNEVTSVRCEPETKPATPIVALRDDSFFISVRFSLPTYGYFAAGYGILHKLRWDAYTVDECSHRGAETPLYLPISAATLQVRYGILLT
jgi:hypothetical protein